MGPRALTIICRRFTSCSGCQLMLLNCEQSLGELGKACNFVRFDMVSTAVSPDEKVDVALVEGAISTPFELQELLNLRRTVERLVAVGSCALNGGVNTLVEMDRQQALTKIYGAVCNSMESFPPQPVERFVKVDGVISGCPPERHELLQVLAGLSVQSWPALPEYAVCMECRIVENRCLLVDGREPCLGPVTRAGCRARCPSVGVPCEGCRGEVDEANRDEAHRLLLELGLSERDVCRRMARFNGGLHG